MEPSHPTEFWNERYGGEAYAYGTEPNDFLAEVAGRIPAGPVLSVAEGEGRNAVFLAGLGHPVVGVDASSAGLAKARRLAAERGVSIETIVADLNDFEIAPATWSGIVSISAHVPPKIRRRIHEQAVEGLIPGGAFVLEAYTPAQIEKDTGGPKRAELTMDVERLREELRGLDFEIARELERPVHEGLYHTGTAAVVQILAFKP